MQNFTPDIVVEDITDEDEEADEIVELQRIETETAGCCDGCGTTKPKLMLTLTYSKNYLTLCPLCEGITLTKLLSNYLRRKARGKTNGFTGDILKEEADDLEADEQDMIEQYGRDWD